MHSFVGRQPIFDQYKKVSGYELLYRAGLDNVFPQTDGDAATTAVINNSFFDMGIQTLAGRNRAFINFSKSVLLHEYALLLPKESLVVEVLENVKPEPEVIAAVRKLKENGYVIAMDDFVMDHMGSPFLEYADIIKVDLVATSRTEQEAIAKEMHSRKIALLAEKVETYEDFEATLALGYKYFQGYFYCKPTVIQGKRIPEMKVNHMRLIAAVNKRELDLQEVEEIIKRDVAFSFKLLKYINSALFGLRSEVSNIRQALVILGHKMLRKWGSLVACSFLGEEKPPELLNMAVVRARFCELSAPLFGLSDRSDDLFLLGLLSVLDALLDQPMEAVLDEVPVADDMKAALLGRECQMRYVLDSALLYEDGDWDRFKELMGAHDINESRLPQFHLRAVKMAEEFMMIDA